MVCGILYQILLLGHRGATFAVSGGVQRRLSGDVTFLVGALYALPGFGSLGWWFNCGYWEDLVLMPQRRILSLESAAVYVAPRIKGPNCTRDLKVSRKELREPNNTYSAIGF